MLARRFVALVLSAALIAATEAHEATAVTSSPSASEKSAPSAPPSATTPGAYGATLRAELLREFNNAEMPFGLDQSIRVTMVFALNSRGQLVQAGLVRGSGSKVIDDFALSVLRSASRRFPPAPSGASGERMSFVIPINFQCCAEDPDSTPNRSTQN
ncbi:TonB family protein [Chelatococcus sambhunathii]|uniref:TonB family protein n=1 Tax=Chelatococcus sambhunathii TaxID=363953 RepID=A0ABU1DJX5_9HYPH|nr:TonB family protein [Chelatococcus sambhunathii]MDR4308323.1 TonB family protein [Chelatococcus sambhunathii]